uniref:G-protein coupled receptors family 1 profile domain-containing protein n=1 Tax=Naja naja TaxID=35670 RepID=A0A8C6XB79_NAJNA
MISSLGDLDAIQNYYVYTNESDSYENAEEITLSDLGAILWLLITLITCCIGFVGNSYIIWLLGFQIKRNHFTTFILNLAIADSVYLTSVFIYYIDIFFTSLQGSETLNHLCIYVMHMTYINANFLLTAISIDRCVAVLFPIWHCCSQPKHLSTTVCVLLWISSFLLCGILRIMKVFGNYSLLNFHFLVTAIVCLPLSTLSTMVLFIKVLLKSNQKNQGQLLLTILITHLCFLILVNTSFSSTKAYNKLELWLAYSILFSYWTMSSIMFSCINSSVNPVIYFLVGSKKGTQSKESMKVLFDLHLRLSSYRWDQISFNILALSS